MNEPSYRAVIRGLLRAIMSNAPPVVSQWMYKQLQGTIRRLGTPTIRPIARIRGGGRMHTSLDDLPQSLVYYMGVYEWDVTQCMSKRLPVDGVFVDIGANAGFFTIWSALRAGSGGHVYSFEPQPEMYALLRENVLLNLLENVSTFSTALGDSIGTVRLALSAGDTGLAHIVIDETADVEQTSVPIETLESCLGPLPRLDMMKIDVEGAELRVLKGAASYLSGDNPPILFVEVVDRHLQRLGDSEAALLEFLRGFGYQPYSVSTGGDLVEYISSGRHVKTQAFIPGRRTTRRCH